VQLQCVNLYAYTMQIYQEGKMSQHFAKLKPGDVVEVKGYFVSQIVLCRSLIACLSIQFFEDLFRPIEKLRYTPNMKKHIGMVSSSSPRILIPVSKHSLE